jgi:chromosome partitioning protein
MNPKMTAVDASAFTGYTLQWVHKKLKDANLPYEKNRHRIYFGYDASKAVFDLQFKKRVIAFQIVKGGTGKTSLAHSFAIRANLYGAKVLCIDLDQQANLSHAFHVKTEENPIMIDILKDNLDIRDAITHIYSGLDLLPSRIENAILDNTIMLGKFPLDQVYKKRLDLVKENYDLIVIDCPPALGQSVSAIALASDLIIAPVTPEEFSLSGLKITAQELKNIEDNYSTKIPFKLVLNKFDTRTSLSHDVLSTLLTHESYGKNLFKNYIRASQEFPNCIAEGISIFDNVRQSTAKEDIDLITREILEIGNIKKEVSLGSLEQ